MDREQLRKKLAAKKKKARNPNKNNPLGSGFDVNNIGDMISQVNNMLKNNPDMIKQVSKCVNNVFENKDLMSSIVSQVQDQPIENNTSGFDASNIGDMISQVSDMIKNNPDTIKQVSKCANGVFENKDLLNSLVSQVQDQTLESKSDDDLVTAVSNESKQ